MIQVRCLFHHIFLILILVFLVAKASFALNPYSSQELDELEKEFVQLINQSDSVERNPLATEYINHLGQELARSVNMHSPYFFIVKSNEINAFAGPGGYIGINTQLILTTANENELAAVMAHELSHVKLHHLYQMVQHDKQMRIPMLASILASAALGVINPTLASGALMASLTGFAQDNINLTRAHEKESDRIGIAMLTRAGFDPRGMVSFFKKMQENSRYYYTANIPAILRTHPLDEDRIAEAENRIHQTKGKIYPEHLTYALFKELIRTEVNTNNQQLNENYRKICAKIPTPACQYGQALAFIRNNQPKLAENLLEPLLKQDPENAFYQIAMAQAELNNQKSEKGLERLRAFYANNPDRYAILMAYANALLSTGKTQQAAALLLKGSRHFKNDLLVCETLAQAQAAANQKGYAYLTQSQCYLLQGRQRDAMRHLKQAKLLVKGDKYLLARVNAMIAEVKFMLEV